MINEKTYIHISKVNTKKRNILYQVLILHKAIFTVDQLVSINFTQTQVFWEEITSIKKMSSSVCFFRLVLGAFSGSMINKREPNQLWVGPCSAGILSFILKSELSKLWETSQEATFLWGLCFSFYIHVIPFSSCIDTSL